MFGNKLKIILDKKGWTGKDLSDASNVRASTISAIINGKIKSPNLATAEKIANALNVHPSYFFDVPNQEISETFVELSTKIDHIEKLLKDVKSQLNLIINKN